LIGAAVNETAKLDKANRISTPTRRSRGSRWMGRPGLAGEGDRGGPGLGRLRRGAARLVGWRGAVGGWVAWCGWPGWRGCGWPGGAARLAGVARVRLAGVVRPVGAAVGQAGAATGPGGHERGHGSGASSVAPLDRCVGRPPPWSRRWTSGVCQRGVMATRWPFVEAAPEVRGDRAGGPGDRPGATSAVSRRPSGRRPRAPRRSPRTDVRKRPGTDPRRCP
jgi:hypothetical protein